MFALRLEPASLLALVAIINCACGESDGPSGGAGGALVGTGGLSAISGPMVGAWYGTGPDGDQCIVVCANGKVFTGDRPCTDVTAADFDKYLSSSASGASLTVSGSPQCWIASKPCGASSAMSWNINESAAVVTWCGFDLQLNRTSDPPAVLCDDANRGPC